MATKQQKVSDVIDKYGESITITYLTGQTYSEDSGWSNTTSSTASSTVIPYDYFSGNVNYKDFGNLREGSIRLIAKGTVSLAEKNTFSYRTKTYQITKVNPLPFEGVFLAQVIDASEVMQ
jgi:hypothetical protein